MRQTRLLRRQMVVEKRTVLNTANEEAASPERLSGFFVSYFFCYTPISLDSKKHFASVREMPCMFT